MEEAVHVKCALAFFVFLSGEDLRQEISNAWSVLFLVDHVETGN